MKRQISKGITSSKGMMSKENSLRQLQTTNPHAELTAEQLIKLEHVKDQNAAFLDPEGGGEALSSLVAHVTSVSALSELKNTKNILDAKALAESDGTSETMQVRRTPFVTITIFHLIFMHYFFSFPYYYFD